MICNDIKIYETIRILFFNFHSEDTTLKDEQRMKSPSDYNYDILKAVSDQNPLH